LFISESFRRRPEQQNIHVTQLELDKGARVEKRQRVVSSLMAWCEMLNIYLLNSLSKYMYILLHTQPSTASLTYMSFQAGTDAPPLHIVSWVKVQRWVGGKVCLVVQPGQRHFCIILFSCWGQTHAAGTKERCGRWEL